MRVVRLAYLLLLVYLVAACQALAPAPIPALSNEPLVRPGVAPPAPPEPTAQATATGTGRPRADLVIAQAREPLTLDPGDVADAGGVVALRAVYDTLTQYQEGSAAIEPGLAVSWQANTDATEWSFTLRAGIKFHDGTPLTAEAVKFNFDRWLDPGFKAGNRAEGKQFQVWSDIFGGYLGTGSLVTGVEIVPPPDSPQAGAEGGVVRLKLSRSTAYLPALLALPYFGISSPAAVEQAGSRYGTPTGGAVGTGPFRLTTWASGGLALARNADYWGGPAQVETLLLSVLGDPEAQLAALADGRADLALDIPPDRVATVRSAGLQVVPRPLLAVTYLSLNQRYRPFDDVRVRQALALALDPATLAQQALQGQAAPADQFVPSGLWGRATLDGGRRDLPQARKLLADAGFAAGLVETAGSDGVARPLELWYSNPPRGAPLAPLAQAVAAQLAEAGIRVQLRQDEWASYLAERKQGRFPLFLMVFPVPSSRVEAVGDPHLFLNALFGPLTTAETGYTSFEVAPRLREAEMTPDAARREELYRQGAQAINTDRPRVPLVYPTALAVARPGVTGYVPSPLFTESLVRVKRQ